MTKTKESDTYYKKKDQLDRFIDTYTGTIGKLNDLKSTLSVNKNSPEEDNSHLMATRRDFPDLELTEQFMEQILGRKPGEFELRGEFNKILQAKDDELTQETKLFAITNRIKQAQDAVEAKAKAAEAAKAEAAKAAAGAAAR